MTDENGGAVRINSASIYALLLETNGMVKSVKQTLDEKVLPEIADHETRIQRSATTRALDETVKKVATLELRMYAAIIGILMAAAGLNVAGII